jgi:hypothetical protein
MLKFDHNISVCEKRQFFAENWEKSQKMVIITSTPVQNRKAVRKFIKQKSKNFKS